MRVRVEQSHKVTIKSSVKAENSQMVSKGVNWCHFISTNHNKVAKSITNSLASHLVIYSWLSACPGKVKPCKGHPSACGHLISLRNKPYSKSILGNCQHQYLPQLLVNVYSYCVMMKSVLLMCLSSRLLSKIQSLCN